MGEYTVTDPILAETKTTNSRGQLWLGKEFANKRVRFVIESVEDVDDYDGLTQTDQNAAEGNAPVDDGKGLSGTCERDTDDVNVSDADLDVDGNGDDGS